MTVLKSFSLQPFPDEKLSGASLSAFGIDLQISGTVSRQQNILQIEYQLAGDLSRVAIASSATTTTRRHELWQTTCLEFFLGIKGDDRYWEFNLSPSGDWNIYRFDGYRRGMAEEAAFNVLPFTTTIQPHLYQMILKLDLSAIVAPAIPLDMAITAVIETEANSISYWALTHRSTQADFHQRDSFILALAND